MASPAASLENMSSMEASRGSAPLSVLLIRRRFLRSLSDSRIRTASGKANIEIRYDFPRTREANVSTPTFASGFSRCLSLRLTGSHQAGYRTGRAHGTAGILTRDLGGAASTEDVTMALIDPLNP
jgi:hypothetical protein